MHNFSTQWEHHDTEATLVAMQAKLKAAHDETARNNGHLADFLAAMRSAVRLGTACLVSYSQSQTEDEAVGGDDLGGGDVQA